MTAVKNKLVCIICLKRFDSENKESIPVPQKNSSCQTNLIPKNLEQCEKEKRTCEPNGSTNLYERFLRFVSQYFKLRNLTGRFIGCAKEAKNEDGSPAKLETFCESCGELVNEICGLYKQLRTAQLFLVWKLGQVGELMKRGTVVGPRSRGPYKVAGALTSAMMKQMNVDAVGPVGTFRMALQLKCINATTKSLPDVVVHKGLFPDQWKFTYSATKQTLIRLITVFLLASSQIMNPIKSRILTNHEEHLGNRRPRRNSRKKAKFSPTPMAVKNVLSNDGDIGVDDDGDNMVDYLGNDSDSDWLQGAASPISVDSNASQPMIDDKTEPCRKRKFIWDSRCRRNVVVIAEEDGSRDYHKPKKRTRRQYPQPPKLAMNPKRLPKRLHRSYINGIMRACAKRVHGLSKPATCPKCFEIIPTRREMRRHMRTVHNSGAWDVLNPNAKLECPYCFQKFVTEKYFKTHIDSHENKTVNELLHWFCQACGLYNYSEDSLTVHMKEIHQNKYLCTVCNEEFETGKLLRDHLLVNHETDAKPFFCEICKTNFTTHQFYRIHRALGHKDKRKISCDFQKCWQVFDTIKEMGDHLKNHFEDLKKNNDVWEKLKVFQCKICETGFLNECSLTLHELLHTSERSTGNGYECLKCNKNINCKDSLVTHYKIMHGDEDEEEKDKPYQCPLCQKRFSSKDWFDIHVRLHDKILFEENFICDICDVKCVDSIALSVHRQRHDETPRRRKVKVKDSGNRKLVKDSGNGELVLEGLSKMKKGVFSQVWRRSDKETRFDPASPPPPGKDFKRKNLTDESESDGTFIKFSCNVEENCVKDFETAYLLRKHLENDHEADKSEFDRNIYCYYCYKRFFYKQSRDLHERARHKKKIMLKFKCDLDDCRCRMCFYPVEKLNEHLESHLEKNSESESSSLKEISFCRKCNWGFMRPEVRDLHELIHISPGEDDKFKCPSCDGTFNPYCALRCHYNKVHGVNLKPNKCSKCDSGFLTKEALRKHFLRTHLGIKLNRGKDNRPRKKKVTEEDKPLDNNRKQLDDGPVTCDEPDCGKILKTEKLLRYHKRVWHEKRDWICDLCGAAFVLRCKLNYHMKTHEGPQIACDVCGLKFSRNFSLNEHKESKHNPNRTQNSICSVCGKSFYTKGGLRMHFESAHIPESEWRLKCSRCPRRFYRRMLLRLHLKTCGGKGGEEVKTEKTIEGGTGSASGSTSKELSRRSARGRKKKRTWCDEDEKEMTDKSTTDDEMEKDKHDIFPPSSSTFSQQNEFQGLRLPYQQSLISHQLQHDPQKMWTGGMVTATTCIPQPPDLQHGVTTLPLQQYPQMIIHRQPLINHELHQQLQQQPNMENSPEAVYQSPTSS